MKWKRKKSTLQSSILNHKIEQKVQFHRNYQFIKQILFRVDIFQITIRPTISAQNILKSIMVDGNRVELMIWNTVGQDIYRGLAPLYYQNAEIAWIIFDITNAQSFESVKYWIKELQLTANQYTWVYLYKGVSLYIGFDYYLKMSIFSLNLIYGGGDAHIVFGFQKNRWLNLFIISGDSSTLQAVLHNIVHHQCVVVIMSTFGKTQVPLNMKCWIKLSHEHVAMKSNKY
jgi:hypothetical protein